jgi:hypothetical protein
MRKFFVVVLIGLMVWVVGCDMAKDAATTTEDGSKGATGIAEKMSQGTVGATNEDTGETGSGE